MHRLKTIQKQVKRLDPMLKDNDDAFKAAVILLANSSNELKTPKELSKFTGYPAGDIRPILANLKKNKLGWSRDGVFRHSGWRDKETGNISFWIDVTVGMGYLAVA